MLNPGFDPGQYMSNLEMENQQLKQKQMELAGALTSQGFTPEEEQNLIQFQLETDKILERLEHFLKGDMVKFNENGSFFSTPTKNVLAQVKKDLKTGIKYYIQEIKESGKGSEVLKNVLVKIVNKDGNEINVMERDSKLILSKLKSIRLKDLGYQYIEVLDEEKKPLNEYGVAEMMRIISMYLTKETFLSFYTEERIQEILGDLGDALADFLYCNYEKMGMDSKFKESKFSLLIINILHAIENCYRRAIGGNEQLNLRSRSIVTQSQGGAQRFPTNILRPPKAKWNPLKPSTW